MKGGKEANRKAEKRKELMVQKQQREAKEGLVDMSPLVDHHQQRQMQRW